MLLLLSKIYLWLSILKKIYLDEENIFKNLGGSFSLSSREYFFVHHSLKCPVMIFFFLKKMVSWALRLAQYFTNVHLCRVKPKRNGKLGLATGPINVGNDDVFSFGPLSFFLYLLHRFGNSAFWKTLKIRIAVRWCPSSRRLSKVEFFKKCWQESFTTCAWFPDPFLIKFSITMSRSWVFWSYSKISSYFDILGIYISSMVSCRAWPLSVETFRLSCIFEASNLL